MQEMVSMVLLAIIQAVSEWFPISSSGHLVVFSEIFGFVNSVQFDVALHFGTLMAVFVYFGKDIVDIVQDLFSGKWNSSNSRLGFMLIISAIPAAVVGFLLRDIFVQAFSSLVVVAFGFAITSLLLLISSLNFKNNKKDKVGIKDAFIMGASQAASILPGISRSGATISTGLLRGLDSKSAMKFSFLMSIPVIFGASILEIGTQKLPTSYILPTLISFVVGMLTIHLLLKIVGNSKRNLRWFALYDILLAIVLFIWLIFR